jgi:hypothetical protein
MDEQDRILLLCRNIILIGYHFGKTNPNSPIISEEVTRRHPNSSTKTAAALVCVCASASS